MIGWIILTCLLLLTCLVVFLWTPAPEEEARERMEPFSGLRYAHRGLYDLEQGIPENSLPAFQRAVEHGFGIELDIHLTTDGQLVVFHDDDLERGCGVEGKISDRSYAQLQEYPLFSTDCRIPLFTQVLEAVAGKVPLIIEVKYQKEYPQLCQKLMEILDQYEGRYCVESFHPFVVRWFWKQRPEVCRGLLSMDYARDGKHAPVYFLCGHLLANGLCKPHFEAYCQEDREDWGFRLCRRWFHTPAVAWTVRSLERETELRDTYDAVIFEHYLPDAPQLLW